MNVNCVSFRSLLLVLAVFWTVTDSAAAQESKSASQSDDSMRTSSIRPSDGRIVDWSVIGPLPIRQGNALDFAAIDVEDAAAANSVRHEGEDYFWTRALAKNGDAVVDLSQKFGADVQGTAYATAEIYVNRDTAATLQIETRTRDKIACWVNGQRVTLHASFEDNASAYETSVRLRFGFNKILIGLRHAGEGPWSFSARMLAEDGKPINPKRLRLLDDLGYLN